MGITFTDRELEVMNILWDRDSATVKEARQVIGEDTPYTSVLSIFQTLEQKGHVGHEREGRAYRYYPLVEREEAGRRALSYVLHRLYKGSPSALLGTLVDDHVDEKQIDELADVLRKDARENPAPA